MAETGAMYLVSCCYRTVHGNPIHLSGLYSNKCLLLMLLELSGGQLGSSVDLGWAPLHVRGGLVLAGVTKATRVSQFHSLCLLSSHRLAQARALGDGWGVRVSGDTQGPWGPAWNGRTTFSWAKQAIGQPTFKGWGNRCHFFSERGTVKSQGKDCGYRKGRIEEMGPLLHLSCHAGHQKSWVSVHNEWGSRGSHTCQKDSGASFPHLENGMVSSPLPISCDDKEFVHSVVSPCSEFGKDYKL